MAKSNPPPLAPPGTPTATTTIHKCCSVVPINTSLSSKTGFATSAPISQPCNDSSIIHYLPYLFLLAQQQQPTPVNNV